MVKAGDTKVKDKEPGSVRSVERAADILTCLGTSEKTLTEISQETGLSKATAYRILGALQKKDFVAKEEDGGKYFLHWGLVGLLSENISREHRLVQSVQPYMQKLWRYTGETVTLYVRKGYNRVCVAEFVSQHFLKFSVGVGTVVPLSVHTGSPGNLLLAYMAEEEVAEILTQCEQAGLNNDTTERGMLFQELQKIKRQGWASSLGERINGGSSLSVPIWNRHGKVVASLNIFGPSSRLNKEALMGYLDILNECAASISARLGASSEMIRGMNNTG
ncbi:IclR family transcriptional regulator [Desulfoscipio sp. XC116]|uniref:IclR family transcriptional regulator n=1 Tax=Desulfoscipio sp. XC116 TaxID=3144975 RepID=UPI00325C0BA1